MQTKDRIIVFYLQFTDGSISEWETELLNSHKTEEEALDYGKQNDYNDRFMNKLRQNNLTFPIIHKTE